MTPDRSGPRRRRPRRAPRGGGDRRCVARPEAPAHVLEGARRDRVDRGQGGRAGDRRDDRGGVSRSRDRGRGSADTHGANGDSPYRWIVDPLDGMMNFVHGYPYFAVSIALAHGSDADARRRARSRARRALHRDQGTRRATQQRADPHVGVHAHAGCADRHRRPDAEEPAAAALSCRSSTRSPRAARCGAPVPARSTWRTSRRAGSTDSSR